MTQSMFFVVAFVSALGITFGGMLGLALAGIAEPQPAFGRSYLWYLIITTGTGCIETVVMVHWAWPKFLVSPFDRDVPGALAVRRSGRFMRHRPQDRA